MNSVRESILDGRAHTRNGSFIGIAGAQPSKEKWCCCGSEKTSHGGGGWDDRAYYKTTTRHLDVGCPYYRLLYLEGRVGAPQTGRTEPPMSMPGTGDPRGNEADDDVPSAARKMPDVRDVPISFSGRNMDRQFFEKVKTPSQRKAERRIRRAAAADRSKIVKLSLEFEASPPTSLASFERYHGADAYKIMGMER